IACCKTSKFKGKHQRIDYQSHGQGPLQKVATFNGVELRQNLGQSHIADTKNDNVGKNHQVVIREDTEIILGYLITTGQGFQDVAIAAQVGVNKINRQYCTKHHNDALDEIHPHGPRLATSQRVKNHDGGAYKQAP